MPVYNPPSLISLSRSTPRRCSARCSPSTGSGIATASPSPFSAFRGRKSEWVFGEEETVSGDEIGVGFWEEETVSGDEIGVAFVSLGGAAAAMRFSGRRECRNRRCPGRRHSRLRASGGGLAGAPTSWPSLFAQPARRRQRMGREKESADSRFSTERKRRFSFSF
ncbi:unnamed protein product [Linum trigynum]|uniref:Uncharacterized protein n=1 Tax=Linum trigynum TaxID=586398 RepID=A0AAV2FHA0_9ROSI